MAYNPAIQGRPIHLKGYSYSHVGSSGQNHQFRPTLGATGTVDLSLYTGRTDSGEPSWSVTGSLIDTNGSLLFNNDAQGGSLRDIIIVNRGAATAYIGFNSAIPFAASGFPLASGESMQRRELVTEMWAITTASTTTIAAQGLFRYNRYNTL